MADDVNRSRRRRSARRVAAGTIAALTFALAAPPLHAAGKCGGADTACETPLGSYHIALPREADGPLPAFVYFHGAGGNGRVHDAPFVQALNQRGYAVIAPNGLERPASRFGPGWFFRPQDREARRDELAFTREFVDDAVRRHGIDRDRVVLAGFSIGASLVWYLACADHDLAAAYAPYAGGFWRPHPADCDGPVRLLHTHGWRDQTVPLEGRPVRGGTIEPGDIFEGLQRWREENGCTLLRADEFSTEGRYWRRRWTSCADGTALELALWPGGHVVPDAAWSTMAADWVEATLGAKD